MFNIFIIIKWIKFSLSMMHLRRLLNSRSKRSGDMGRRLAGAVLLWLRSVLCTYRWVVFIGFVIWVITKSRQASRRSWLGLNGRFWNTPKIMRPFRHLRLNSLLSLVTTKQHNNTSTNSSPSTTHQHPTAPSPTPSRVIKSQATKIRH